MKFLINNLVMLAITATLSVLISCGSPSTEKDKLSDIQNTEAENEPDMFPEMEELTEVVDSVETEYYFEFDQADYYHHPDTGEIWMISEKGAQTPDQKTLLDIMMKYRPNTLDDNEAFTKLEKVGYAKYTLPENVLEDINEVFSKKLEVAMDNESDCIPIFRDIIIFKRNGKRIGMAKICFECNQKHIIGTEVDITSFNRQNSYEKLIQILDIDTSIYD